MSFTHDIGVQVDHELALPQQATLCIADLENKLDIRAEVIETILSLLEAPPFELIKMAGTIDDRLEVKQARPQMCMLLTVLIW